MTPTLVHADETAALLAVIAGARTTTAVAKATGVDRFTAHRRLVHLRTRGLVTWEIGRHGTVRPLVRVVTLP